MLNAPNYLTKITFFTAKWLFTTSIHCTTTHDIIITTVSQKTSRMQTKRIDFDLHPFNATRLRTYYLHITSVCGFY